MRVKFTSVFLLLLFFGSAVVAQDGTPDASFGTNGFFRQNFGQGKMYAQHVLRLASGKFLVGGRKVVGGNSNSIISRFNANGSIDAGFGKSGTSEVQAANFGDSLTAMAELPSGKILGLSVGIGMSFGNEARVFRLDENGKIDSSFGTNGIVAYHENSSGAHYTYPYQLHALADGSFYVLCTSFASGLMPRVVKFLADGAVDNTYGENGAYKLVDNGTTYVQVDNVRMKVETNGALTMYWMLSTLHTGGASDSVHLTRILPDGSVDLSFGSNGEGYVRTAIPYQYTKMADAVTLPDGNLMLVLEKEVDASNNNIIACKIQPDGSLVNTFGTNGIIPLVTMSGIKKVHRAAVLQDGSVVTAGNIVLSGEQEIFTLKIGNTEQDYGYGSFGTTLNGLAGIPDFGGQVLQNADGTLWLVGHAVQAGSGNNWLTLYNLSAAGNLVSGYGDNGVLWFNNIRHNSEAQAAVLQADGKIIVAGVATRSNNRGLLVGRFNNNGTPDAAFGMQGVTYVEIGAQDDAMLVRNMDAGKFQVIGNTLNSSYQSSPYIMQFNADGSRDVTFGTNGLVVTNAGSNLSVRGVAFLSDGKILMVANQIGVGKVLRFHADGTADNSFGTNGAVTVAFGYSNQSLEAIQLDAAGNILVAGSARDGATSYFGMARLLPDGTPDITFNGTGVHNLLVYGTSNNATSIMVQPDGKIIFGGTAAPANAHFAVVRLLADGTLDASFGDNGRNYIQMGNFSMASRGILLPDGRVVLSGLMYGAKIGMAMACFNSDGSVAAGFGNNGAYTNENSGEFKGVTFDAATGKIIVSGKISEGSVSDYVVTRFNYVSGTLPLSWGAFNVAKKDAAVLLSWNTIQEINTHDFVVQHSSGNGNWNDVGNIVASGNATESRYYAFLHAKPAPGKNQYRIMQRDRDGRFSFSETRAIQFYATDAKEMIVSGNIIADGNLRLQINTNGKPVSAIRIVNAAGQVVLEKKAVPGTQMIRLETLNSGVYYVQYGREVEKIIVSK